MPSSVPITAENNDEMPTSAIVGQAFSRISSITGWLLVYERPRLRVAVCFRYCDELVALRAVEAELLRQLLALLLGEVPPAEEVRDRIRLDHPEQEEVEDDDEEQRRERAEDLGCD